MSLKQPKMKGFSLKWLQENVFDQLSQSAIDESPILGAFQSHVKTAHETATSASLAFSYSRYWLLCVIKANRTYV